MVEFFYGQKSTEGVDRYSLKRQASTGKILNFKWR